MNRHILALLPLAGLFAFSACEGEPPKVPTNPPATDPGPAPPSAASAAAAAFVPSAPPTPAPCPSAPVAGNAVPTRVDATSMPPAPTPSVAAAHAISGTVTTVPAHGFATAVVYLEDAGVVPERGASAVVDNRGMSFAPYITVVAAGGRVVFSNSDPFPHNVFSPDNERFNLGMVPMKGSTAHAFKTPGVYTLLCNLHPNMLGYVVVSPSSYFAKANAKGQFAIKDVPAGAYKITAWAPRLKPVTEPIVIKDTDVTLDFALHR